MMDKRKEAGHSEVMADKGNWIFEDGDIFKIKLADADAMSKFYFANYERLKRMARAFKSRRYWGQGYDWEEMLQQVFIDLPYYDYSSRSKLYSSIVYGTFLRAPYGGITVPYNPVYNYRHLSIDAQFEDGEENYYMLDKFVQALPIDEILAAPEKFANDSVVFKILRKAYKNKDELNRMYCHIFTDLKPKDIKGDEYADFIRFKD